MRQKLESKIRELAELVQQKYHELFHIGILEGQAGAALFQFYCAQYFDEDSYSDAGMDIISHIIDKINDNYAFPSFSTGIAGFTWTIQHLQAQQFIDIDYDDLLSQFDNYLSTQMKMDFEQGEYDFMHGALGYAFYFLYRYEHTKNTDLKKRYQSHLSESINSLERLSIQKNNTTKWKSFLDINKTKEGYNLGLSHGIPSILYYLSRLQTIDVFKESAAKLIAGGANYMLELVKKDGKNLSLFPTWIEKDAPIEYDSRIAWCYGDLGIGLSLLRAGRAIEDVAIQNHALEILKTTTTRRMPDDTLVNDAGICHGSYGNALIYQSLFQKSNDISFKKSLDFWIEDGVQKAIHKDGYGGYKQWNGHSKIWTSKLSVLEGIAGIGLVIIDYLSEKPNSWNECLMIS
ncbi:MAG: lanthionine synthetase C family protein [Bacteroidota bacterium]